MQNDVKPRILSVDDNEVNRYTMRRIFERQGFEVIDATNGQEALESLKLNPDLVLLDVNLPDMSGFEICRLMKAQNASLPVLQVSASFIQNKDKVEGLESGADAYLAQPIDASVIIATVNSILRVRKAEREKELLIQELKDERNLRERLIASLTHDLRNPLAAAKIGVEILKRKIGTDQHNALLSSLERNIHRTDLMIQDILDVSLLKAGQRLPFAMQSCDLQELAEDLLSTFELTHGRRFNLICKTPGLVGVWNSDGLKRAIENLLTNAVKYGDKDRPIDLILEEFEADQVRISVRNFGNVIPESDQQTLFEEFHRTPSAKSSGAKGWGLGLTLVKGIAEAHGGRAEVVSSEKEGTIFSLVIPLESPNV